MTSKLKLLVTSSGVSLAMLCSAPAFAGGTTQGTSITNNVNVNFQVGGVPQTQASASDVFVVDRKVIFSLAEKAPIGTTSVSPGQTGQITTFVLANTSNDTLDFTITPSQLVGGTAAHGGTDAFNVTNLLVCLDANADNTCDAAATATLTINDLVADANTTILVVGDIPLSATNGQVAGISLSAAALNSNGTAITAATDATVNGAGTVETIFADTAKSGNGGTSVARDGIDVATDDYTVSAAVLSVFKTSRIISDGVSSSNFKSVPGAVVEYCISVANAASGATATNITISDLVPTNTTYQAGTIRVNGTVTSPGAGQTCAAGTAVTDASDVDAGSFGTPANTVAGTLNNIAGGSSSALIFRATIN
ncbi:hypothetical protein EUU23_03420 [Sphingorhabdus sp. IMCC26285]|jgi:uncharacterized repeat protein (TIGR01451 family)|uniref:DUF11 domain-containing protein n=1 Tax=Sphingorhabdus profundilacus TaxID=2509718 RepID=A0A6I4LXD8_9SPHN|nr:hypothetical protein [Sphingorhabdus profundilacus]MVZ96753.1 hypothetical protein [Sphingorhabdus profundilacus]